MKEIKKESGLVAGVIASATKKNIIERIEKAKRLGADLVEMRLDLIARKSAEPIEIFNKIHNERNRLNKQIIPLILTIRRKEEGGGFPGDEQGRLWLYKEIIETLKKGDMIDIELNAEIIRDEVIEKAKKQGLKVIVSHHNFEKTPFYNELQYIIEMEKAAGADVAKVAFRANNAENVYILQDVLTYCGDSVKPVIVLPMGKRWKTFRLLVPFLTENYINYGVVFGASAPGQPTVRELKQALNSLI